MSRPHVDQCDRDQLDDHNVVDHEPAGDGPDSRTAPVIPVFAAPAGAVRNIPPISKYQKES